MVLQSRVRGIEHEYTLTVFPPDVRLQRQVVDEALNQLRHAGCTSRADWILEDEGGNLLYEQGLRRLWAASTGPFPVAYNGMRVYDDAGHFEVATPVCRTSWDLVIYCLVGELYALEGAERCAQHLGKAVHVYKNNVSNIFTGSVFDAVSYGTHYNIQLGRGACSQQRWSAVRRALLPYLVARLPLAGGGEVVPVAGHHHDELRWAEGRLTGSDVRFVISPRVCFVRQVSSLDTTRDRGLLNERDEPHADPERYWRFHDIHHEGIRAPFQIWLSDVLQSLIFAGLEAGLFEDAPELEDPVEAARALTMEPEVDRWEVRLRNGQRVKVLEDLLEGFYLARLDRWLERAGDRGDRRAFEVLQRVVRRLAEGRIEEFCWGLDWVTKLELLGAYQARGESAVHVMNQYALVDGGIGYYRDPAISTGACDSLYDPAAALKFAREHLPWEPWNELAGCLARGLREGPSGTREGLRSYVLRELEEDIEAASWWRFRLRDGTALELPEPIGFDAGEAGAFLAARPSLADIQEWVEQHRSRAGRTVSP